jgi:hypothetical protein
MFRVDDAASVGQLDDEREPKAAALTVDVAGNKLVNANLNHIRKEVRNGIKLRSLAHREAFRQLNPWPWPGVLPPKRPAPT